LDRDGVSLAYDVAGPDGAPAVVLLHGITGARSTWHDIAADLAADHRVHALDHRGHGGSSKVPGTYDIEHWAADLVAFLENVVGEPAILVGHSLGGVIAAEVSGTRTELVRAAFLEDPPMFMADPSELATTPFAIVFPLLRDHFRAMRDRSATLDEYIEMVSAMPALNGAGTTADVLSVEGVRRQAQATMDFDPEALTAALDGGLAGHDPRRSLGVPVVVLRAEPHLTAAFRPEDEEPFRAANPDAEVELVPGASHLIHDEQPELFLARVRAFLHANAP
jgi:pimeloyl-ACP methyl ester carboxylesterase